MDPAPWRPHLVIGVYGIRTVYGMLLKEMQEIRTTSSPVVQLQYHSSTYEAFCSFVEPGLPYCCVMYLQTADDTYTQIEADTGVAISPFFLFCASILVHVLPCTVNLARIPPGPCTLCSSRSERGITETKTSSAHCCTE